MKQLICIETTFKSAKVLVLDRAMIYGIAKLATTIPKVECFKSIEYNLIRYPKEGAFMPL